MGQGMRFGRRNMAELHTSSSNVIVEGKRLETLFFAPTGQETTIVMLHEGLGSVSMWRDFPEQIAQETGCGVLAYSRYGHGRSDRLAEKRSMDFMHHEAQVVLPALLHEFRIQEPILVGHSDGASIALIYAGLFPEELRALILEAPHVFVEDLTVESIATMKEAYQTTDLAKKLRRHHDHVDEAFWGWNDIWLDPSFRSWNIEEYLEAITCPVLVIQGENDEYGTIEQVRAIKARIPNTEALILDDCGHAPHRDQPELTLEAMTRFALRHS
jgi:pimeloyl-ACP methyl ester carboxylesterase